MQVNDIQCRLVSSTRRMIGIDLETITGGTLLKNGVKEISADHEMESCVLGRPEHHINTCIGVLYM